MALVSTFYKQCRTALVLWGILWKVFLVTAQRPLVNHTSYNSIPTSQHNNYKLRNGRTHDMAPIPPSTVASMPLRRFLYEENDSTGLPPLAGRRDNRRRLNFATLGSHVPRGSNNPRRGIESLRKELMKASVGGPGGGISDHAEGYSSYSATSSIGKIDGLGSLGPAHRYGDLLQTATILAPSASIYSTKIPPAQYLLDHEDNKYNKLGSIGALIKLNNGAKQRSQADEPLKRVTDDSTMHEKRNPLQAIKDQLGISSPYNSNSYLSHMDEDLLGVKCTFETPCAWKWTENLTDGFRIMNSIQVKEKNITGLYPGPVADSLNDAKGHFLYARILPSTEQVNLTSPQFSTTMEKCFLEIYAHQSGMSHGVFSVVVEPLHSQENPWVPAEIIGDDYRQWQRKFFKLGRITRDFRIVFEIVPKLMNGEKAHVAIDNLRMVNCFPEGTKADKCGTSQVKCMLNKVPVCIPLPRICDITKDCDDEEDELLNCDKIPYGGRCDFDKDWCGWRDSGKTILSWSRHTGSSPTYDTGPDGDHTYQHLLNATGGYYMLVNMNQHSNNSEKGALIGFASNAIMVSKTFNPPPLVHGNPDSPYRNSCVVRFYIHQFGKNPGSINLSVVEMKEKENITTTLWWNTKNQGDNWLRAEYVLPNITSRYYLQFEARMGMRIFSDVAVDDVSLSPECFGINIPKEHLNEYNYWDIRHKHLSPSHKDFENKTYLELSTCGVRGMVGPTQQQCENFYDNNNKSHVLKEVHVIEEQTSYKGMQKWKVPHEGYYTIIAKGASGGLGSSGVGSSRGAVTVSVLELHKNEELYILVGQQGEHACIKSLVVQEEGCASHETENTEMDLDLSGFNFRSKQKIMEHLYAESSAGGGGGASYVFLLNSAKNEAVPLLVAGGGGGLGFGLYMDEDFQHGQKANFNRYGVTGQIHGELLNKKTAGPGGGWRATADQALDPRFGAALLQGGRGGHSCYMDMVINGTIRNFRSQGGFGGGGGGCNTGGGGGGGYAGGDVYLNVSNGEGGTSFINNGRSLKKFNVIYEGANSGAGSVIIIAAIEGCGCDYRCIALDEFRSTVRCICPEGWKLKRDNNTACEMIYEERIPFSYLIGFFIVLVVLLGASLTALMVILYNRYQRKKQAKLRHMMLLEQDVQLNRLRHNVEDSNLNNFNPNYGCDGILNGHVDVNSLPQVARESLRLVKALGQGAFGEVYQGLYRHRDGDAVEMPVAVKTLPEMSTRQAEEDFLMEAAIMAKFNHPNMVHLIGVCFDRHPRFIVLELLAGGDLKNFLREGRSKPERPSPLTMKDLLFCALDVAKGCHYMESKRFIHRDIAARNCLLSSKGPGRVVKIADFGMARDIYRSDYYRKGGKAMLPIKWMPPEAFLDGIFTSKTDVWSFGVLLWEVFSLGLMPYTGLPNPEVMQLVTNGGRLSSPPGCPSAVYKVMADCWNPTPEDRPTFSNLLDRLTTCTQDPVVMNAPLPCILRPPSTERDQTIMRPPRPDEFCLQVPHTDYLIPLPGIRNSEEYPDTITRNIAAVSTGTDACTPPGISPPLAPRTTSEEEYHAAGDGSGGKWETSFILTNSISNQPLLSNTLDIHRNDSVNDMKVSESNSTSIHLRPGENSVRTHLGIGGQMNEEEEAKLISLDTPQPTPTTMQPPLLFSTQLDCITLDPASLTKTLNSVSNNKKHCSYANLQLSTSPAKKTQHSCTEPKLTEKLNGIILQPPPPNGNNNNINGCKFNSSNNTSGLSSATTTPSSATAPPFTVQGYTSRYNDNHSEISC